MSQLVETTFLTAKEIKDGEEQAKSACVVVLNPNRDGSILAITKQKEFGNIGLPGGRIDNGTNNDFLYLPCSEGNWRQTSLHDP